MAYHPSYLAQHVIFIAGECPNGILIHDLGALQVNGNCFSHFCQAEIWQCLEIRLHIQPVRNVSLGIIDNQNDRHGLLKPVFQVSAFYQQRDSLPIL